MDSEIDKRLDAIVRKVMATDPDHRYQSAAAVRVDLDVVLTQPIARVEAGEASGAVVAAVPVTTSVKGKKAVNAGSTPPKSKTPRYAGLGLGALAVVGIGIGIGAFVLFGGGGKQDVTRPSKVESAASETAPAPNLEVRATPATPVKVIEAPKPEPPKPVVAGPPAKPVAPKPDPVAVAPPKAPEPIPTPVAAKPAVPTAASPPPTTQKPGETQEAAPPLPPANPLLAIPGMKPRLDAYHTARNAQLTELATKYGRGLETRLGQAADAGDLALATAFTGEKNRIASLVATLAALPADPIAAAGVSPALEALSEDAPESLANLRQTWTAESSKILADLDGKLEQSMQALESELTRARDFEKATAVLAWRESLAEGRTAGPPAVASVSTTSDAPAPPLGGSNVRPTNPGVTLATKDVPFKNSLDMKFVPVPGTEVLFCIHETRWRDYEEYAKKAKGSVEGSWKTQDYGFEIRRNAEDYPVAQVSWDDAQAFCRWLSEKEGRTYRLPTDREWSLAVGIGDQERWEAGTTPATVFKPHDHFPWGTVWPPPAGAGNYSDASRQAKAPRENVTYVDGGYDDGHPTTAPVMSFEPNTLGLFDMGGNVWEWCEDWHSAEQRNRASRGGAWDGASRSGLLSSTRRDVLPGLRQVIIGFRVVLEASAPAPVAAITAPPVPVPVPVPAPAPAPTSAPRFTAPDPALARATKDAPFENSLGMKFVPVPGTEVLFCIHEVRYKDYVEYARKAKETVDGAWRTQTNDGFEIKRGGDEHPVARVSWEDAQKFCAWLSEKEGKTYRLPTDREWSLAVGIGHEEDWKDDTTPETVFKVPDAFPWGDEWPPPAGAGNYSDASRQAKAPRDDVKYVEGGYDDTFPTTAPVMSFEANKLGLYDLGGNVWEWCEDWYSVDQKERVLRGGSWNYNERGNLLSSGRIRNTPDSRNHIYGFRVVVEVSSGG